MIHTLTTSLALYKVHRNKVEMLTTQEKRKAFCLLSVLVVCMALLAYIVIFYITGCAFDPLGAEYHETSANKRLRLQNEATVAQYWQERGIDPDKQ